jgi:hypothetical protein
VTDAHAPRAPLSRLLSPTPDWQWPPQRHAEDLT